MCRGDIMIGTSINIMKDVCAHVYLNGIFSGCAIIFSNNNIIYLVTAFHVVKPIIMHEPINLECIAIQDENGRFFSISSIRSDKSSWEKTDIVMCILNGPIDGLRDLFFLSESPKPHFKLMSRVKSNSIKQPSAIFSLHQNENVNNDFFLFTTDKALMENSSGDVGATALKGISGSGVFLMEHNSLVLVGIISSIPDEAMLGKIKCCCTSALMKLEPNLKKHDDQSGYGINNLLFNIELIRRETMEKTISSWESNPENVIFSNNIDRKINELLPDYKVTAEKIKIVCNLLNGNSLLNEISKVNFLKSAYEQANVIFDGRDLNVFFSDASSAHAEYKKIHNDYMNILADKLIPLGMSRDEILLLSNKDIATWLGNCDLDFIK